MTPTLTADDREDVEELLEAIEAEGWDVEGYAADDFPDGARVTLTAWQRD
jgi:hypothetical protein